MLGVVLAVGVRASAGDEVTIAIRTTPLGTADALFTDDTFSANTASLQAAIDSGDFGDRVVVLPDMDFANEITLTIAPGTIVFDDETLSIALSATTTIDGFAVDTLLLAQWSDPASVVPALSVGVHFQDLGLATVDPAWSLPAGAPDPVFPDTWIALATGIQDLTPFTVPASGSGPPPLVAFYPDGFAIDGLGVGYQGTVEIASLIGADAAEALGYVADGPAPTLATLTADLGATWKILDFDLSGTEAAFTATLPPSDAEVGGWLNATDDWVLTLDYTVPEAGEDPNLLELGLTGQLGPAVGSPLSGTFPPIDVAGTFSYTAGDIIAELSGELTDAQCGPPDTPAHATGCWVDVFDYEWLDLTDVVLGATFRSEGGQAEAIVRMDARFDADGPDDLPPADPNVPPFDLAVVFSFREADAEGPAEIAADVTFTGDLSMADVAAIYGAQGTAVEFPGQDTLVLRGATFSVSTALVEDVTFSLTATARALDAVDVEVLVALTVMCPTAPDVSCNDADAAADNDFKHLLILGVKTTDTTLAALFASRAPELSGTVLGELTMPGVDYTVVIPLDDVDPAVPPYDISVDDLGNAARAFYGQDTVQVHVEGNVSIAGTVDLGDLDDEVLGALGIVEDEHGHAYVHYAGATSATFDWGHGDGVAIELTELDLTAALPEIELTLPEWLEQRIDASPGATLDDLVLHFLYDGDSYLAELRTDLVVDLDNSGTDERMAIAAALTYDEGSYGVAVAGTFEDDQCGLPDTPAGATGCWVDVFGFDWVDLTDVSMAFGFTHDAGAVTASAQIHAAFDVDGPDPAPPAAANVQPFGLTIALALVSDPAPVVEATFTIDGSLSMAEVAALYGAQGTTVESFPDQDTLVLEQVSFSASTEFADDVTFTLTAQARVLDAIEVEVLVALTRMCPAAPAGICSDVDEDPGNDYKHLLLLGFKSSNFTLSQLFHKTTPSLAGTVVGEVAMPEVNYTVVVPLDEIETPFDFSISKEDLGEAAKAFYYQDSVWLHIEGNLTIQGTVDLADLGDEFLDTFGFVKDGEGRARVDYTGSVDANFDWGQGDGVDIELTGLDLTAALPTLAVALPDWLGAQEPVFEDPLLHFNYDGTAYHGEVSTRLLADIDGSGTDEHVAVSVALGYVPADGAIGPSFSFTTTGTFLDDQCPEDATPDDESDDLHGCWVDPFGMDLTVTDAFMAFEFAYGAEVSARVTVGGSIPIGDAALDVTVEIGTEGASLFANLHIELVGEIPMSDIVTFAGSALGGAPPIGDELESLLVGPGAIDVHVGADPTLLVTGTTTSDGVAADIAFSVDGDLEFLAALHMRPPAGSPLVLADFYDGFVAPIDDFELPDVVLVSASRAVATPAADLAPGVFGLFKHLYGCEEADTQEACTFDLEVDAGVGLMASVPLPESIAAFKDQLSIDDNPVLLQGFVPIFGGEGEPSLAAVLPPIVPPAAADPAYWLRQLQLRFEISPSAFSLAGEFVVLVGDPCPPGAPSCPNVLTLALAGNVDVPGRSISLVGTLDGEWVHPFDLDWLIVRNLAVVLGVKPGAVTIGLGGSFDIGDRDFSGSILVDILPGGVPLLQGIRAASSAGVTSNDLFEFQQLVAGPGAPSLSLGALPSISLKNVEFSYAAAAVPALCLQPGIVLAGDLYVNPVAGSAGGGFPHREPCEPVPPAQASFCPAHRHEGCFVSVRLTVDETRISAHGSLGSFSLGPPAQPVLVWDDALVDLELGPTTQQLTVSGAAEIPGFMTGYVELAVDALSRSFKGDFEIYGVFFAKVDAVAGVADPSAPFSALDAGFEIHAELRSGFGTAVASAIEPLLAEQRRIFGIVGPIFADILSLSGHGDPLALMATMPSRLQALGVPVPAILNDIAAAVGTFSDAVSLATAPFDAYIALDNEIGILPDITVPQISLNPAQLVDVALNGLTLDGFSFPGAEIPFVPRLCNGGLGFPEGDNCWTVPPRGPVYAWVCAPWPWDDHCAQVPVTPPVPGVPGVWTPPFCAGTVQDGKCYGAGLVPIPAPHIPGLCDVIPGVAPRTQKCSVGGLVAAALDLPLRTVIGSSLAIPPVPSLQDALDRLRALFDDSGSLFSLNCATIDAQVGVLQASNTASLGVSATILGTTFGDTIDWKFDDPAGSAYRLTQKLILTVLSGTPPAGPECTPIGTAPPVLPPRDLTLTLSETDVDENGVVTLSATFVSEPGAPHDVTVDWRDGAPEVFTLGPGVRTFVREHRYLDDGRSATGSDDYQVTVTIKNRAVGSTTGRRTITVHNVPPTITAGLAGSVTENGTVTVSGSVSDVGTLDTHTVVVDWGEGPPTYIPVTPGDRSYSASHQYLDDNPSGTAQDVYPVSITVTDDDLGAAAAPRTTTVINDPPHDLALDFEWSRRGADGAFIPVAAGVTAVDEGDWITVRGSFVDVGSRDRHTVVIEWNDGGQTIVADAAGVECEDARPGCPVVTSTATSATLRLPVGVRVFTVRHQFADDNPTDTPSDDYQMVVRVGDDDTGSVQGSQAITVHNVVPSDVVLAFGLLSVDENDTVVLKGSFEDPGVLDTHTVVIDWGDDGAPDQVVIPPHDPSVEGSRPVRDFEFTHRYLDDNPTGTPLDSYTLTLALVDDDGGVAPDGRSVFKAPILDPVTGEPLTGEDGEILVEERETDAPVAVVADVPPEVEIDVTPEIDENQVATATGSFFDPGTLDAWEIVVDWGDGSAPDSFSIASGQTDPVPADGALVGATYEEVFEPVIDPLTGEPELGDDGQVVLEKVGVRWSFELTHQYIDDNPTATPSDVYTVTAGVTDDDVLSGEAAATIRVFNVLPTIEAGADQFLFEDQLVVLDPATFRDMGTADTHSAAIYWGDGSAVDVVTVAEFDGELGDPAGAHGTLAASHRYRHPGAYQATVCVVDDDQPHDPVCDTFVVTVVNAFLEFAVFGDAGLVRIGAAASVAGDVGGNGDVVLDGESSTAGTVVSVGDDVHVGRDAWIGGNVIAWGDVRLRRGATVAGDVDAGRAIAEATGAVVGGATVIGPAAHRFPDVTWVQFGIEPGLEDRRFKRGGSLAPGSYGSVRADRGSLRLESGLYRLGSLRAVDGVVIELDLDPDGNGEADPIVVEVADLVRLDRNVQMIVTSAVGGPSDVLFLAGGSGGPAGVDLGAHGTFVGTFITADGGIDLRRDATHTGALAGAAVRLSPGARVSYQPALELFAGHLFDAPAPDGIALLTVDAGNDRFVYEDDLVVLDPARFFDVGVPTAHWATIDWGDGVVTAGTVDEVAATVSGSHRYEDPGHYVASVCVQRSDPGVPVCMRDSIEVTAVNGFFRYAAYGSERGVTALGEPGPAGSSIGEPWSAELDGDLAGEPGPSEEAAITWVDFAIEGGTEDVDLTGPAGLSPGIYGDVRLRSGTLRLGPGVYRMRSLRADDGGVVELDFGPAGAPIVIEVENRVSFGAGVSMAITSPAGDASDFLVLVADGKIELADGGSYLGTYVAARGKADLGKAAALEGGLYGTGVHLQEGTAVAYLPAAHLFADHVLSAG